MKNRRLYNEKSYKIEEVIYCIKKNDYKHIANMVDSIPFNYKDRSGRTLIHLAARDNSIACADIILKKGKININEVENISGNSALHESMLWYCDRSEFVRLLLSYNCNPMCKTKKGEIPLHIACGYDYIKCVEILLYNDNFASINTPDDYGLTPLHKSCKNGSMKCVKFLLEHGADDTILCNNGFTAFDLVKIRGKNNACLLEHLQTMNPKEKIVFIEILEYLQIKNSIIKEKIDFIQTLACCVNSQNEDNHSKNLDDPVNILKEVCSFLDKDL